MKKNEDAHPRSAVLDDLPTEEDRLDFAPYVETLADLVTSPATRTPLTIGVFGTWGSGKTSLLKDLVDSVKEDATSAARENLLGAIRRERSKIHVERVQFLDQFQRRFRELVKELVMGGKGGGPEGRLAVLVDDLDRCLPEKAVEVLGDFVDGLVSEWPDPRCPEVFAVGLGGNPRQGRS